MRALGLAVLALGALASACASAGARPAPAPVPAPDAGVAPELAPLCEALGRAVEAREDEDARRLLARLLASAPSGRAAELARGYQRILDGRAELARCALALALEPLEGRGPEAARLVLVASQPGPGALRLRLGPATLVSSLELVDRDGREGVWRGTTSCDPLGDLTLEPDALRVLPLAEVELAPPPGALAARSRFELVLRAGELERAGAEPLPAAEPRVRPLVVVRAEARLSARPVEPAELARAFEIGLPDAQSALELSVRVPPERAEEALDRLAPLAQEATGPALEQLVPALRWLAPQARIGGDPWAWRAWLGARAEPGGRPAGERAPAAPGQDGRLELPRAPRPDGLAARGGSR